LPFTAVFPTVISPILTEIIEIKGVKKGESYLTNDTQPQPEDPKIESFSEK